MRLQFAASIVLVASLFGIAGAHSVHRRELQKKGSKEHEAGTIPLAKLAQNCDECQVMNGLPLYVPTSASFVLEKSRMAAPAYGEVR